MDKKVEILLFEDNPGDADLIGEMLEEFADFPYKLKNVETLNEGLNLLKERPFDVILSDLRLPDSDGIDTFLDIHGINSRIPIILLTGMNDEKIGIDAVKKGAQDYLVKGQVDGRLLNRSIRYSIERKKAEDKIQNLAKIVESSNDAIITESLDGIITSWNKGAEQIYGYSAEEILGKHISILAPPLLVEEAKNLAEVVIQGGKIHHYETPRLRKDGTIINVSMTLSPVFDNSEKLTAISIIARDITERKKAEKELQKSEERYRIVTEQTGQLIYDFNIKEDKISWAGAIEEITGYTTEEFKDMKIVSWLEYIHPDDLKPVLERINTFLKKGGKLNHEFRFRKKDGSYVHIEESRICLVDENGSLYRALGIMTDITRKKEAEEILAKIDEVRKKEIHHRIKNNLQVVSSLLDLQAEKFAGYEICNTSKVLKAFRDSQNRVISMALIHEELYESRDVSTLNFAAYLKKLTKELFKCYNIEDSVTHLVLETEEKTYLEMDTVVPLGIIVNELVSNSLKHAFPGRDKGKIQIKLYREENEECKIGAGSKNDAGKGTSFILIVSDNGVGIPESLDLESPDTLGMQLVTTLVDQLEGEIELKRTNGTEFTIRFTVEEKL